MHVSDQYFKNVCVTLRLYLNAIELYFNNLTDWEIGDFGEKVQKCIFQTDCQTETNLSTKDKKLKSFHKTYSLWVVLKTVFNAKFSGHSFQF